MSQLEVRSGMAQWENCFRIERKRKRGGSGVSFSHSQAKGRETEREEVREEKGSQEKRRATKRERVRGMRKEKPFLFFSPLPFPLWPKQS
jgi:hypothetical protein